jgi:hypothetical protein
MGHADNEDEQLTILDLPDEPVVVHSPASQAMLVAPQRLAKPAGISRPGYPGVEKTDDPLLGGKVQAAELAPCVCVNLPDPGHA